MYLVHSAGFWRKETTRFLTAACVSCSLLTRTRLGIRPGKCLMMNQTANHTTSNIAARLSSCGSTAESLVVPSPVTDFVAPELLLFWSPAILSPNNHVPAVQMKEYAGR